MSVMRKYKPGEFCWTDLGTKDVAAAKKFYKGIFGWTATDLPMGDDGEKYSMMRIGGKDVAGLYPMPAEQRKAKAPPFWLPYVCVKSADKVVKQAKAAGGKICMAAMDVMGQGRMAIVQDPTGAVFGLWQPLAHGGAALADKPGTALWHDLNTLKPKVAGKFYVKLGWTLIERDIDGHKYYQFNLGKQDASGMWPEPTKKLPPSWITHWKVADCAKTAAKAKRLGGRVLIGPIAIGKMGSFAILKDPQGAAFGIIGK